MTFKDLRVKEIRAVVRYKTETRSWVAKDRADHIIGIQLRGRADHTFNFGKFEIYEGCVYFLNRRDDYKTEVLEPCEAFSIHFTTYEEIEEESFCVPSSNPTGILSILQKAEIAESSLDGLNLCSLLYKLCAEVSRTREKGYAPKDGRISRAKEYIDLHFREETCLALATCESGLSSRRFGELFRKIYDVSPGRYIVMKKIEYAKKMLITGHFSIREISESCSFSDIYYFSKVFKKETGMSPSAFRQAQW